MIDSKPQENTVVTCECSAEEITLLPCSGGSNCGQITNQAAGRKIGFTLSSTAIVCISMKNTT